MSPNPNSEQPTPHQFNYREDENFDVVDDELHEDSIGRVHSDDELELVVKELLHNSNRVDADDITVIVDKCNVHLSGSVKSQKERDEAIKIVKLVHGVGEVESDLIVKLNDGILPTDIGRN